MSQLRITQVRSTIDRTQDQRATVRSLGLKRIRHTVVQPDRPEIRGMLRKIPHLVEIVEAGGLRHRVALRCDDDEIGVGVALGPVRGAPHRLHGSRARR